jgi:RNA polymerase sigma factor (sigma-70 family)
MPAPRDDHTLLRAYVERRDESAFAELVARHADMVYASALRQVGRNALAEDVTQAVFILLARKASGISERVVVAAWLHKATRYTALNAMKIEQRRRAHERRAGEQAAAAALRRNAPAGANANVSWAQGAVLLDEGVARLGGKDREAIVLRFLERRSFAEVATALHVSEEAAQMRVNRAIEKLRVFFRRHGLAVTAVSLRAAVNANAVVPAPGAFKIALAPTALRAVDATTTTASAATSAGGSGTGFHPGALADHAGRAMDLAALRTTSGIFAGSVAAAAVVGLLLWNLITPNARVQPTATLPAPATRPTFVEEGKPAAGATAVRFTPAWLAASYSATMQRTDELLQRQQ